MYIWAETNRFKDNYWIAKDNRTLFVKTVSYFIFCLVLISVIWRITVGYLYIHMIVNTFWEGNVFGLAENMFVSHWAFVFTKLCNVCVWLKTRKCMHNALKNKCVLKNSTIQPLQLQLFDLTKNLYKKMLNI